MSEPALPSAADLAESRARHNVPASWVWRLCGNPTCAGFVWIDPAALGAGGALAVGPAPCCSEACVHACLEAQLRASAP
jgi:hypothetical protein